MSPTVMVTETDKIKHLYHRAAFGGFPQAGSGVLSTAVEQLLQPAIDYMPLQTITLEEVEKAKADIKTMPKEEVKDIKQLLKSNVFELNRLWYQQMINSPNQLQEKMALFWHGHFACRSVNPYFDQQYLDVLRKNALGNFGTLLKEVSKTPSMLQFLNNQQNKKEHPNENFAREVMELFTLGRGKYTEQDVKEAARAFTGYGFNKAAEFKFRGQQHDFGTKSFLDRTGDFNGDDILDIILEQKDCARFVAGRVYQFFVNDEQEKDKIELLATRLFDSGYDIRTMMECMLTAAWFYDEKHIGAKIKSPIELLVGMSRTVPVLFEDIKSIVFIQRALGQVLLNPPSVAGWKGGKSWIDSSSLLFRMRLSQVIYYDKEVDFSLKEEVPEMNKMAMEYRSDAFKQIASKKLAAQSDWTAMYMTYDKANDKIKVIADALLAKQPTQEALHCARMTIDYTTTEHAVKSAVVAVMSLPEYQLC